MRALVLVLSVAVWAQNTVPTKSGSAEQELLKLEKEWSDAVKSGDTAFFERIYAADIVLTDECGMVTTGAQDIASMKSGDVVYSYDVVDNMKVHVYGDAAVVIGRSTSKGKEKGKEFSRLSQWTDTWVKIAGRWQCVAGGKSPMAYDHGGHAHSPESCIRHRSQRDASDLGLQTRFHY